MSTSKTPCFSTIAAVGLTSEMLSIPNSLYLGSALLDVVGAVYEY